MQGINLALGKATVRQFSRITFHSERTLRMVTGTSTCNVPVIDLLLEEL